jgi:predicted nucleic acid-binding protein
LLPRVLDLSDNFSAPDAAYVALAEHLGAPLLTTDERLARATQAFTDVAVLP